MAEKGKNRKLGNGNTYVIDQVDASQSGEKGVGTSLSGRTDYTLWGKRKGSKGHAGANRKGIHQMAS